jgi:hypothetical protein
MQGAETMDIHLYRFKEHPQRWAAILNDSRWALVIEQSRVIDKRVVAADELAEEPAKTIGYHQAQFSLRQREVGDELRRAGASLWPKPTTHHAISDVAMGQGRYEATDGCRVEEDGVCPHGYPSWMLYYQMI